MHTLSTLTVVAAMTAMLVCAGCADAPSRAPSSQEEVGRSNAVRAYSRGIVQSIDLIHLTAVAGDSIVGPDVAQTTDAFKFTILMEDHSYQTVLQTTHGDLRVGDRVHVSNGAVRRY